MTSAQMLELADRLAVSENSILRLSGRKMAVQLDAAERDLIVNALRASAPGAAVGVREALPTPELIRWIKDNVPLYFNHGDKAASYTWNPEALAEDLLAHAPLSPAPAVGGMDTREATFGEDGYNPAYDEGITYAIRMLAKLTGSQDWQMKDGSEDHETDVCDTIMDVLKCAGLYDDETGKFAALPQSSSDGLIAARISLGNQLAMMGALHQLMRGFLAPDPLAQERLSARIQATRVLAETLVDGPPVPRPERGGAA